MALYYLLDDIALYRHQNYTRSLRGLKVSWNECVEILCANFGVKNDPLEDFIDLRQTNSIKTYIQDFNILWNKTKINEK